ncbi:hypothetical protein SETIT_2G370700v2 [Setaria italica]|uniref:Uncharacterized protein n=1 Tax=Setaria italica TaxID=4555 RepID=A0A368Q7S5_SETIT|nr:hypothetical protein SETIT_2G370700v2 [Setaria italica]
MAFAALRRRTPCSQLPSSVPCTTSPASVLDMPDSLARSHLRSSETVSEGSRAHRRLQRRIRVFTDGGRWAAHHSLVPRRFAGAGGRRTVAPGAGTWPSLPRPANPSERYLLFNSEADSLASAARTGSMRFAASHVRAAADLPPSFAKWGREGRYGWGLRLCRSGVDVAGSGLLQLGPAFVSAV